MMEDDFYATIKFKNGEEVFAKVVPSTEDERKILIITNPITIKELKTRNGFGYKVEPWLKTTDEDMFIVNMEDVLTISESNNIEIINMHTSYIRKYESNKRSVTDSDITRKMGYISSVSEAKKILEKLYNNS